MGAFRRKTQTIVVTFVFFFFQDQPTDRFYKFYKLTGTNTKLCHTASLILGIKVTAFLRSAKQKDMGSRPTLDQKFFVKVFGFVRLFFRKFFFVFPKGPPFIFFLFCSMDVQKLPKGPVLQFSALLDLPETKKKSKKKFKKNRNFFQFFPHAGTGENT